MLPEDTEDMNRGCAETRLRQLAEAELRRAIAPDGTLLSFTPQAVLQREWARSMMASTGS